MAIVADIGKAFLMVAIRDRKLRCLTVPLVEKCEK